MTDIRKLAEEGWNAYFAHDLDACTASYADDAEVVFPGAPPIKGHDAIRAVTAMYLAAFPDERPTSIRHIADGTTVVTEFASEATHSGPLMMPTGDTLPPTGRRVSFRGAVVQDVAGDKVVKQVFYFDNAELLQQLGLMPGLEGAGAGAG
jgi:uncharacterized protein (TIGR02246 family)